MSYDEPEDFTYNPFAEDNDCLPESNLANPFSSSSAAKFSNPQLASLSEQNSVKGTPGKRGKRFVPEISIVPHSAGLHPLKSAALAAQNDSVPYDLGVTRPHLSRIINERTLINVKSSEFEDNLTTKTPLPSDEETEVIVHEASPLKLSSSFYIY